MSKSSTSRALLDVTILVSAISNTSRGSVYLGCYLGTLLSAGGMTSKVNIVPLPPEGGDVLLKKTDHVYVPTLPLKVMRPKAKGKDRLPIYGDKEHGLECYSPLESSLKSADVIIVCVESKDTNRCITLLQERLRKRGGGGAVTTASSSNRSIKPVGIISMQRGVKNSSQFTERFDKEKYVTILEGVPGLEVVSSALDNDALVSISHKSSLVLERLTRQKVQGQGVIMAELLESSGLPILYRKHLTTHTWGVLTFYGCFAGVNCLTGGSLKKDVSTCHSTRLVIASMLRECRMVMKKAAKQGKWAPDVESSCGLSSLKWIGYILCLPTPFFRFLAPFILPIRNDVSSSFQMDLHDGLETSMSTSLGEIESVGKAYLSPTPVLSEIIERIKKIASKKDGVTVISGPQLYRELGKPKRALQEAMYVWMNIISALFLLCLLPPLLYIIMSNQWTDWY